MVETIARKNVNDGYYNLDYNEDGVYITVYPAIGSGKKVTIDEVINRLARKKIKNYSRTMVEETVKKPTKMPVKIAEYHSEELIEAGCNVHVSADKMKAYITITPPDGGGDITMEKVMKAIESNGIQYGINKELLESAVNYPEYNEMILIAQGKTPENGKNGRVEFHFDINIERRPTILEDGRVDFRELNIIQNVMAGEKLCTLIPPIEGINGKNVLGADVPSLSGKQAKMPKGRNVELNDEGTELYASIDGEVEYADGKISVMPNYEVSADVGTSTGNINFVGNVVVRGNVVSGFVVEAGGSVEVYGVVEGAIIKAKGDIVLRRGMQGLSKGMLICGGDVIARYIENSTVEAGNCIKAEAIMHSNIMCGNSIEVSGRKGLIVGGNCKVGSEIKAKVIGSHMATSTELEVGIDPRIKEKYKNLKNQVKEMEANHKKTEQAIKILQKMKKVQKLTKEKDEMLAKSIRTVAYLASKIKETKSEIQEIEIKLNEEAKGKIHVAGNIYQGTRVIIGTAMFYAKETLQHCTLYKDGADVRIGAYEK